MILCQFGGEIISKSSCFSLW